MLAHRSYVDTQTSKLLPLTTFDIDQWNELIMAAQALWSRLIDIF